MLQALVIADDLTGAADSGLAFHRAGSSVAIRFSGTDEFWLLDNLAAAGPDVLVLSTETRHSSPHEAHRILHEVGSQIRRITHGRQSAVLDLFKKIDSTLRGHAGAEVHALLDVLPDCMAWIVPSYPKQGRRMSNGVYTVHGRPLADTEFARDIPDCPPDSRIAALFASPGDVAASVVSEAVVDRGTDAILARVRELRAAGRDAVLFDAATDAQIERIVVAGRASDSRILWVGSAGLAGSLAGWPRGDGQRAALSAAPLPDALPDHGSVIIAAGSRNAVTSRQVAYLVKCGAPQVIHHVVGLRVDPVRLPDDAPRVRHVLLTLPDDHAAPAIDPLVAAALLGEAAAQAAVRRGAGARLVLIGGDIAVATCRSLKAEALEILGAVEDGVPLLRIRGGMMDGALVITKAGGFGTEESLYTAYKLLVGNEP